MATFRRSKRLRRSTQGSSDETRLTTTTSAQSTSSISTRLEHFFKLPHELKFRILRQACIPTSSSSSSNAAASTPPTSGPACLDVAMTLNLALTSRWFNAQATLLLWSHIVISRPSALTSLQLAVASRPQLGRIIKSLHVGPVNQLQNSRTPVRLRLGYRDDNDVLHKPEWLISTSLRSAEEAKLLPRWCQPGQEWSLENPEEDCKGRAITAALGVIEQHLGIKLKSPKDEKVGHIVKLFEAQAALDLYLMEIRRCEDKAEGRSDATSAGRSSVADEDVAYPPLVLLGVVPQPTQTFSSDKPNPIILTRQQLLRHLARPSSPINNFDHPLLLARSGMQWSETTATLHRWQPHRVKHEPEDVVDTFTTLGIKDITDASTCSPEVLDPALVYAPTAGSLLGILRSVLALTPRLETLSLSGFLERALCGKRAFGSALKSLRCVSLGPPPPVSVWYAPLNFEGLHAVRKLRLCALFLHGGEALEVAALEQLEEVQWSVHSELPDWELKRFGCLIDALAGRRGPAAAAALRGLSPQELDELHVPPWYWPAHEEDNVEAQSRNQGILVEVRLPPKTLQAMLSRAVSEEEQEDWVRGRGRDGGQQQQHRLLLTGFPVADEAGSVQQALLDEEAAAAGEPASTRQALFDEGRGWWERHSGLAVPAAIGVAQGGEL